MIHLRSALASLGMVAISLPAVSQQLEEIIVTAEKRSENLQDVPVSITAFTGDQMQRMNFTNLEDIAFVTPGLQAQNTGGYAETFLRGVGANIKQPNAESSIATFIDGFYMGSIQGAMQELADVERVEVLRGPQATLYGRNASGGAINLVTKKPNLNEAEGSVSLGYGADDEMEAKVFGAYPLSDTVAVSFAGVVRERDSYIDIVNPTVKDDLKEELWAARGKLLWQPSDSYQLEISVMSTESESSEEALWLPLKGALTEADALGSPFRYFAEDNKMDETGYPAINDINQSMLHITQEFQVNDLTIKSLTGGSYTRLWQTTDIDGSPIDILHVGSNPGRMVAYSQEIQVISDATERWRWVAGGSYYESKDEIKPVFTELGVLTDSIGLWGRSESYTRADGEAWAGFFDSEYDLTDKLTVSAGIRYTVEEKSMPNGYQVFNGIPTPSPVFDCAFAGLTFGVDCGGAAFGLPPIPDEFVGAGAAALNGVQQQVYGSESEKWNELTWKFIVSYAITDDITVYYNNSRGFKAGLYNLAALNLLPVRNPPVDPEILESNEIGIKSEFLDGQMRLNAAIFHYDFQDVQAQVVDESGTGLSVVAPAGDARIVGGELELSAAMGNNFSLSASISVLDSEYKEFRGYSDPVPTTPGGGITGAGGNLTQVITVRGADMVRAPKFTSSVVASYVIPQDVMNNLGDLELNLMWAHNDGFCYNVDCRVAQESYNLLNANITFTTIDEKWKVIGWINNLTDEQYYRSILQVPTGNLGIYSRPRYGGVKVEYSF